MDHWNLHGRRFKLLTDAQADELHEASLRLLSTTGCVFQDEHALQVLADAGARVDFGRQLVRFPFNLVEAAIRSAPKRVLLAARNPQYDIVLEGDRVYFGPGTLPVNVLDLGTGQVRRGTTQDCFDLPRLIDALPYIHFYKTAIYPDGVAPEVAERWMVYGAFASTEKEVSTAALSLEGALDFVLMAEVVAGGSNDLRERPLLCINVLCSCPLVFASTNTRILTTLAERGIPLIVGSEPQAGTTAPVTLLGAALLQNAEALAGITLAQIINAGTPVIMGAVGSISDLKSGNFASGAVELGLMNSVAAQMSQRYGIPLYATGGMSDAKVSDTQAGYEKALQLLLVALSGGNYIHDAAGLLDHCLTFSYEQYVIDNEICGMVARALGGLAFSDETMALGLIDKVGPGGHFLGERHTLNHLRSEHFLPELADRDSRASWERKGSRSVVEKARARARQILNTHQTTPLPEGVDRELRQIVARAEAKAGGVR
jgi:trimethylamine--corrinoid protein Co-methyltransferase